MLMLLARDHILRSQSLMGAAAWGQRDYSRYLMKGAPTAGRGFADGSDVGVREAEEGRQTPGAGVESCVY